MTPFYDPMIAKIIAWGEDRATARARLARALADTAVLGVATNLGFSRGSPRTRISPPARSIPDLSNAGVKHYWRRPPRPRRRSGRRGARPAAVAEKCSSPMPLRPTPGRGPTDGGSISHRTARAIVYFAVDETEHALAATAAARAMAAYDCRQAP